jgi:hypothetical protein
LNKQQKTDLDRVLDGYEQRDKHRQQEVDARHRGERDFYAGFRQVVADVIKPEMARIAATLTARGHRCAIEEEAPSATNEGYDRPGSVRFTFIPDQRYSQGREDPAAVFSAGSNMKVQVAYSVAVPVITDPEAVPRDLALAEVTEDVVSGQIVAMVKALL